MKNRKRIKKLETEIKLRDSQVSGIEDQLRQTNIRISRLTERFEKLQNVTEIEQALCRNWFDTTRT